MTQGTMTLGTGPATRQSPWFVYPKESGDARIRLYCLPYAGGGASIYQSWPEHLKGVEVVAVQLPGREGRINEPPYDRIAPLVDGLADALAEEPQIPFALFGHSMGGRVAFELVRELRRRGAAGPVALFVSACNAPHIPRVPTPPLGKLPQRLFVNMLRKMNGTPPEFFDEPELLEVMLPALRADFTVIDTYEYVDEEALSCPLHVFGGTQDGDAREDNLLAWQAHTTASFRLRMLDGGHFVIRTRRRELLQAIGEDLVSLGHA